MIGVRPTISNAANRAGMRAIALRCGGRTIRPDRRRRHLRLPAELCSISTHRHLRVKHERSRNFAAACRVRRQVPKREGRRGKG